MRVIVCRFAGIYCFGAADQGRPYRRPLGESGSVLSFRGVDPCLCPREMKALDLLSGAAAYFVVDTLVSLLLYDAISATLSIAIFFAVTIVIYLRVGGHLAGPGQ
jgi:hypothetical protein